MKDVKTISLDDFARAFGDPGIAGDADFQKVHAQHDFGYETVSATERDALILDVLGRIEVDRQVIAAPERKDIWEKGWSENLEAFKKSGSLEAIVPKFIRGGLPVRWQGEWIRSAGANLELAFLQVFRNWLFRKYFSDVDAIYEFGCGSGYNLAFLAELFPGKRLFGGDFVPASVELINRLGGHWGGRIDGFLFDMIRPDNSLKLAPNSGVLTFGSIEQLGGAFEALIQFLIERKPKVCVHVEPVVEVYDERLLFDALAARFHKKRGYTQGLLPHLEKLKASGAIKTLQVRRSGFGSMMMEGYTVMTWTC